MDAAGARALAERIASGPPQEQGEEPNAMPRKPEPRCKVEPQPQPRPQPRSSSVEIVYVKPAPGPRREVRIYVRGPDGELERRR
jgi:hypothetical protein